MPPPRQTSGYGSGAAASTSTSMSGTRAASGTGGSASLTKGRRGSKAATAAAAAAQQAEAVEVEDFGPPEWRTVLNSRADLGWPDFYPSRPGFNQPEDVLTEENVKNGFVARTYVAPAAESFSMRGPIFNNLISGGLGMLVKLGQDVLEKRDELMPQIGERSFRIPPRVTYNDTKRFQFLADAGNPSIPLHRLMRDRIPHGFKGVEALDAVFAPPTAPPTAAARAAAAAAGNPAGVPPPDPFPLDRAVWFIRALGANEVLAHRTRVWPAATNTTNATSPGLASSTPGSVAAGPVQGLGMTAVTPVQLSSNDWYTIEFTNTFTSWLRIQLGQLVLPATAQPIVAKGAVKPTAPPVKAPGGVLGDEKGRARWLQKWEYSLKLLRQLHTQRLVSSRLLVSWFADFLAVSNLAQIGFVAQMVNDYLVDVANHPTLARVLVRAICGKIKEIQSSLAPHLLGKVDGMLRGIVKSLYDANSEVIISLYTWRAHSELLREICRSDEESDEEAGQVWQSVQERNERLGFKVAASDSTTSPRRNQMEEISKLDSISSETDMNELCRSFFDGGAAPDALVLDEAKFEDKVFILLNWSMGLYHLGIHRPYATYTMLRIWTDNRDEFIARSPRAHPVDLFPILYKWLDVSPAARKQRNVQAIGITFGEFTRAGLYSYSRYLQTLIAHGHTVRSRPQGPRSHHLDLLSAMPIFVVANDLLQQRRIALSGDSLEQRVKDEAAEREAMDAFREECKEYVPELYGFKRYGQSAQIKNEIDHHMPSTENITRFIFLQARFELAENSEKRLKRSGKTPAMDSSAFARVIQILHLCQGYSSIADFLVRGLRLNNDFAILRHILDALHRHADVFTSMDRWPRIIGALLDRFYKLDRKDVFHPRICRYLLELAAAGRVGEDDAAEVQSYLEHHEEQWLSSIPQGNKPKSSLPMIRQFIEDGNVALGKQLGQDLYDKHGPFEAWGAMWWEAIALSMRGLSGRDEAVRLALDAVGAHTDQVCGYLAISIDGVVAKWLDSLSSSQKVDWLAEANPLVRLFMLLVARRRMSTLCILEHLVYGAWKHLSRAALGVNARLSSAQCEAIHSAVVLAQQLFLTRPPHADISPLDQEEALVVQTSRAQVLTVAHTPDLIRHLPFLVILGSAKAVPEPTRLAITTFFRELSLIPEFKTAIFRHLGLLKDAFLTNEWSKPGLDPAIEAGMVDTLKAMMSEGPHSGKTKSIPSLSSGTRLSAWRWTSIVLEMRVEFKRLALRIENGEEALEARETLRRLVGDSLHRETSADDADLLCETFRGIDTVVKLEILAIGLDRLAGLLSQAVAAEHKDQVVNLDKSVDMLLRIIHPASRQEGEVLLAISESVVLLARQRLIDALAMTVGAVERMLLAGTDKLPPQMVETAPEPGVVLRIAIKVTRFLLGLNVLEGNAITAPRPDFARFAVALLRVIVALRDIDDGALQGLCDMLTYIIDATPTQSRIAVHTALMGELSLPALQTAVRLHPVILDVLPYRSPVRRCLQLSGPAVPDDGTDRPQIYLDDRPWELFDYTAPLPGRRRHGEQFLASRPYKDSASIPAALFDPLIKRDALPGKEPVGEDEEESEDDRWLDLVSERDLGNGLAGEPIGARIITTNAYAGPDPDSVGEADRALDVTGDNFSPMTNTSSSSVPLAVAPRRQSTRLSGKMPVTAGSGTDKDPIPIDDEEEAKNDSDSDDESDEPEVMERPPAKRPRVGSKTTTSGRATTGGKAPVKAPAKRTTGGKSMPRKGVGGKSVRGVGSKSAKSVRR